MVKAHLKGFSRTLAMGITLLMLLIPCGKMIQADKANVLGFKRTIQGNGIDVHWGGKGTKGNILPWPIPDIAKILSQIGLSPSLGPTSYFKPPP